MAGGVANGALRRIPSLDALLRDATLAALPRAVALREARAFLAELRGEVLAGRLDERAVTALFDDGGAVRELTERCGRAGRRRHARVINATGIVLHTGIGRAPLAVAARDALCDAAGYAIVEVDPTTGERNQREEAVAALLTELCGAGGALVVNNNAAATTLALAAWTAGRSVIVSRGQLVEIGGGFRMPDVMRQAGCRLVEVGATNRTHLRDFAAAIDDETAALLVVHPSNFLVLGFTSMPTHAELVELGRARGVPVIEDLGSGLLVDEPPPGLEGEPRVRDSLAAGLDATWFSGDKLLGGPQCGILVGDAELVRRARAHPLYRAFRCDKLTLAALEATLRIYRDGEPLREIPTLAALATPAAELQVRAERLADALGAGARVVLSESFAGSGANPARPLPSFAVALPGGEPLADALRAGDEHGVGVITRIDGGRVLLDLRTVAIDEIDELARLVRARLPA